MTCGYISSEYPAAREKTDIYGYITATQTIDTLGASSNNNNPHNETETNGGNMTPQHKQYCRDIEATLNDVFAIRGDCAYYRQHLTNYEKDGCRITWNYPSQKLRRHKVEVGGTRTRSSLVDREEVVSMLLSQAKLTRYEGRNNAGADVLEAAADAVEDLTNHIDPFKLNERSNMNEIQHSKADNLIYLMQEDVVTVGVAFEPGGQHYTYRTRLKLEEGDKVVVYANSYYKVVKVVRVDDIDDVDMESENGYQWIVSKVDVAGYEQALASDQEARDVLRTAKRTQSKAAMLEAAGFGGETVSKLQQIFSPAVAIETAPKDGDE